MKHKYELYGAIICMALIVILVFVVGMRSGLHDTDVLIENAEQTIIDQYQANIESLQIALENERKIEHIEYDYFPLPVEYENIGDVMPEETDAVVLAKTLFGEYRDSSNYPQCASVVWCVLNRVDCGYGTIKDVCTGGQFHGYNAHNPVDAELYKVCVDVLVRWQLEKIGANVDVGRTIPADYLWFEGNGKTNTYRNAYQGGEHITP